MIGSKIVWLNEIDSTNNYMKKHAADFAHGTVVSSFLQTNGRGRANHTWESIKGNLYMSYILKETVSYKLIFEELMRTSLAILNLLKQLGVHCTIKYPNDILVKHKKISGILTETYGSNKIEGMIVGVGINVNQLEFNSLDGKATSIGKETNKMYEVAFILKEFIVQYNTMVALDTEYLYKQYKKHSIVLGKTIDYQSKLWIVTDILSTGELELKHNEHVMRLSLNEVSLRELYDETNN